VAAVLRCAGEGGEPPRRRLPAGLSEREAEVLGLIATGLSNRQVAERLHLAEKTVGNHVQHVYEKIGVSTRAAATLFAVQNELV
jgi:DNA-binding NarL/FixJ family response regulator